MKIGKGLEKLGELRYNIRNKLQAPLFFVWHFAQERYQYFVRKNECLILGTKKIDYSAI